MLNEVTTESFERLVLNNKRTVIVFVWAARCSNCKTMNPIFEETAKEIGINKVYKLNADESKELLKRYKVLGVPTILIFSHGVLIDRKVGFLSQQKMVTIYNAIKDYSKHEAVSNELKGFFKWPF